MEQPQRVLIVGASATVQALAHILARSQEVTLVDSNREHCALAAGNGLQVVCGSALRAEVLREAGAGHADTFIALTPNAEVNALAAQQAVTEFRVPRVHVPCGGDVDGHQAFIEHVGATTLFGGPTAVTDWDFWLDHQQTERLGIELERNMVPSTLFHELQSPRASLPLAVRRGGHYLPFHSGFDLQRHDRIILIRNRSAEHTCYDRFDRLVARCPVLDIEKDISLDEFFGLAAAALSSEVGITPTRLHELLMSRETASSTVIAPGLAIPHVLIDTTSAFHLLIGRCRGGIAFPGQRESVHALFVLLRSPEERNFHLRALAAIAQVVQAPDFEPRWLTADGPEDLRSIVLDAERRRFADPVLAG